MPTYHSCGQCEICFDFCRCEPISQKNDYSCGPVAIRNACWALGIEIPDVDKISEVCKVDIKGTSVAGLRRGAKLAGLGLKRVFVSSINDIFKIMRYDSEPIIFGYVVGGEGHYCVVIRRQQSTPGMGRRHDFIALNWNQDMSVAFGSHSDLLAESVITLEWFVGKLLARGTEIYLVSKGDGR